VDENVLLFEVILSFQSTSRLAVLTEHKSCFNTCYDWRLTVSNQY